MFHDHSDGELHFRVVSPQLGRLLYTTKDNMTVMKADVQKAQIFMTTRCPRLEGAGGGKVLNK